MKTSCVLASVVLCAGAAFAQTPAEPPISPRIRLGPLGLSPRVGLTNLGIDTNVFNEIENPKHDFTATLSPHTDFWLRLGMARVSGSATFDYVYFGHYSSERAVNTYDQLRVAVPLRRVVPYATASIVNARERSGYDLDARVRRSEGAIGLGVDIRAGSKVTLDLSGSRTNVAFDAHEVVFGSRLSDALDRTAYGVRAAMRYRLTPLTTVVIEAEAQGDRFQVSPLRDADNLRIMPGVELDPFAVISGSARVGFRQYDARSVGTPSFRGLAAAADLSYTLRGTTRFSFHAERDLSYSFEVEEPYFLQTGVSGTVTRKIGPQWDVQTTAAWFRLGYRHTGLPAIVAGRTDGVRTVGAGVGRSVGPRTRLGVNVGHDTRWSDRSSREYRGLRLNTSVTYGS